MSDKPMRFDRTITVSLVLAIVVQTASALLWAGAAEARLNSLESHAKTNPPVSERLARIEEQLKATRESVSRIERQLDHKGPRP